MHFLSHHQTSGAVRIGALAIALIGLPVQAADISNGRNADVQRVCKDVMGLSPGEAHYEGCVESLQHTLASLDVAQKVGAARIACANRGLTEGTREFALCVEDGSTKTAKFGS